MYGALATLPTGDVAVVYASEDDPAKQWQGSSVYHSRFVLVRLAVELDWSHASPAALITTTVRGPVARTWTTNLGDEITETVRIRSWDGTEQTTLDPEVQQGRTYTYTLGDTSGEVTVPQLPSVAIVHPLYPEWGQRVVVVADEGRDLPLDVTITDVPSRQPFAGSFVAAPVVTTAGLRGSARGSTTIRTSTLLDAERFERLIADGAPLFISGHVGIDLPDWVAVTGVKRDRFMGRCSCCLDDETDPAQWRHWSLSWVQVGRPSHLALPYRRRIKDYKQPISTMTLPIRET